MASEDKAAELSASEREAFEKWANDIGITQASQGDEGEYVRDAMKIAWEAWQARAVRDVSVERERCARIIEKAFSGVGGSSIADRIRRGEK